MGVDFGKGVLAMYSYRFIMFQSSPPSLSLTLPPPPPPYLVNIDLFPAYVLMFFFLSFYFHEEKTL